MKRRPMTGALYIKDIMEEMLRVLTLVIILLQLAVILKMM
jgi:hypothetical protein